MIEIIEGDSPNVSELESLYRSVGWSLYADTADQLAEAIGRCAYVATARDDGRLIGLLRAVSDDYSIAYVQDILVSPSHQRSGIGRRLIDGFLDRFSHVRQKVLLTDDEERQHRFYESVGYSDAAQWEGPPLHTFVRIDSDAD